MLDVEAPTVDFPWKISVALSIREKLQVPEG